METNIGLKWNKAISDGCSRHQDTLCKSRVTIRQCYDQRTDRVSDWHEKAHALGE